MCRLARFHALRLLPASCLPFSISYYRRYFTSLAMPRKSSRNLRVHNIFALGLQQPTIPCRHPGCPRYFFNSAGRINHMRAAHPSGPSVPSPPSPPPAPLSSPQDRQTQSPPSSPTSPSHFPSTPTFEPQLNSDNPIWHNMRSSSPFHGSESPSENESNHSSESSGSSSASTPQNADLDSEVPPTEPARHSDANFLREDSVGMNIDPPSPSPSVNEDSPSTSGTQAPPPRARRVYHRQMNGE